MTILGVDSKCYILAMFIRSDGERFLLGSGYYEFKDSQQHFAANTIANDVIEVQGNDGYMLGGQVRRPGVQSFDGYVGDGTTSKTEVEEYRRDFLSFFRKNFMYKVVYVFPDGSAIQRKRGFLVDAPTVQELYQIYPEYHVALNFEDINYYFYDEDADGDEIYGKSAVLGLTVAASGGLIWDNLGAVSLPYSWTDPVEFSGSEVTITNNLNMQAPITGLQLKGNTYQQTYSGKNLLKPYQTPSNPLSVQGLRAILHSNGTIEVNGTASSNVWIEFVYDFKSGTAAQTSPTIILNSSNAYTMSLTKEGKATGDITLFIQYDASGSQKDVIIDGSKSFTGSPGIYRGYLRFSTGASCTNATFYPMVELGSTASSYEPYVGGTASPNPDYPQEIQTVTGEQTVSVTGKNLFDGTIESGGLDDDGLDYPIASRVRSRNYTRVQPNTTYTLQGIQVDTTGVRLSVWYYSSNDYETPQLSHTGWVNSPSTFTTPAGCNFVRFMISNTASSTVSPNNFANIQLEAGSTATDYEPYQSQSYTVDLGSTELCKIGDYQDYIYKSGDNWYVHKEIGLAMLGDMNWRSDVTNQSGKYRMLSEGISGLFVAPSANNVALVGASTYFMAVQADSNGTWGCNEGISGNIAGTAIHIYNEQFNTKSSADALKTWLSDNNVELYYALKNPTDTQITNQTLIAQLEALGAMKLFVGENNILVTATTPNMPAILEASYFTGIDFTGAGYEWEPGEAGGAKIIAVDSIDNVYPLLTVTGPATNPTVTNITTGTIFRYNGTVTSSQVLKVDMMNKTATLNGTSVIGNVSGDWLYFQPGDNRVDYSTNNADAPNALIEWQEIVG